MNKNIFLTFVFVISSLFGLSAMADGEIAPAQLEHSNNKTNLKVSFSKHSLNDKTRKNKTLAAKSKGNNGYMIVRVVNNYGFTLSTCAEYSCFELYANEYADIELSSDYDYFNANIQARTTSGTLVLSSTVYSNPNVYPGFYTFVLGNLE